MCGISALFSVSKLSTESEALLKKMNRAQAHRGPDDEGYFADENVVLGHRRLSIIDLSGGHQPIFNEDATVAVVFNGEIFNHRDIANQLKALGHTFSTHSDTETIVHAWEEWGVDSLQRFRGMFAFILWDSNSKQLFIARDRLGVKPLFYTRFKDGTVGFGSELKVLTEHPKFKREVSAEAVEDYLAFGYVPDPKSIYASTYKLEAGHYLLLHTESQNQDLVPVQYWDLPWQELECPRDFEEESAKDKLIEELQEAVNVRLEAEVPLGAFLSGGVDSSAIVALMARSRREPVNTCSVGFDVKDFDETEFAKLVADRYETNHFVDTVNHEDFSLIERLIDIYDEPYADSSALPTYKVCELARKQVTVSLSGDGGDELFAGYRRYKLHMAEESIRQKVPLWLRRIFFKPLGKIYPKLDWAPQFLRAKTTFQSLGMTTSQAFLNSMSKLRKDERDLLYSQSFKARLASYSAEQVYEGYLANKEINDPLKVIQYLDYKTWLTGDANTKVDRASMANGLEVRSPFMDHKLVEWAFLLPSGENLKGGETKSLLKRALEPFIPFENIYRKKMGFSVPMSDWLRGPLKEKMYDVLNSKAVAESNIFNMVTLNKKMEQHVCGKYDHGAALWTIFMLGQFLIREEEVKR